MTDAQRALAFEKRIGEVAENLRREFEGKLQSAIADLRIVGDVVSGNARTGWAITIPKAKKFVPELPDFPTDAGEYGLLLTVDNQGKGTLSWDLRVSCDA